MIASSIGMLIGFAGFCLFRVLRGPSLLDRIAAGSLFMGGGLFFCFSASSPPWRSRCCWRSTSRWRRLLSVRGS